MAWGEGPGGRQGEGGPPLSSGILRVQRLLLPFPGPRSAVLSVCLVWGGWVSRNGRVLLGEGL